MAIRLRSDIEARVYINAANYDTVAKAEQAVRDAVRNALAGLGSDISVSVGVELSTR